MVRCICCDATLSSPPHACLRSLEIVGDEDGCEPGYPVLGRDHEIELWADRPR